MSQEIDNLVEKADIEFMLEFETQIFLDVLHKDGLVVAAKGINLDLVVLNILKVYCDPGNLVLVINSNENEEKYFLKKMQDLNVHVTTFSSNTTEREDLYLSGGIHFVTTRILVVDMLKKRIPIDKITGIIVLRAHKVIESCQEAFILRLYRQNNKTGFIKAFSNSAQSFTMGFGHVERVMKAIFVKELYIWPRFHSLVIDSLKKHQPKVIELHIPVSEKTRKIQTCILELMNLTVKEIKKNNKTIELQEISVENCLVKKFHKTLQVQLDMVWHQLSYKSHQLIADLKTLRHLLIILFYSDSVTFYTNLLQYRTKEYAQNATWVWLDPAEMLFSIASSLIFSGDKELNPEFCPKWESLLEILKVEIPNEIKKSKQKEQNILILCTDNKTCYQIKEILIRGPNNYLFHKAIKSNITFKSVNENFKNCKKPSDEDINEPSSSKKAKVDDSDDKLKEDDEALQYSKSSYLLTMSQSVCPSTDDSVEEDLSETNIEFEPFAEMENMNLTQLCENVSATQPKILIQTFKGGENYISLQQTLNELKPNFIVLYHCNITAVREIEMYEAHRQKEVPLLVFFLLHNETVEEQSYLTSLRREKEAFEHLIERKSTMVVPEDQDGKSEICEALQSNTLTPTKNTRQGGKEEQPKKQIIIVDMREFRSELPALIHKRGIDIEPLTITVGDYIITSEICVERKSLSDLVGSLNSGRLYQQCVQMFRYYTKPMLLIEFDHNKPFSWQNHYMLSSDSTDNFEIQQKLLLLTLHFPKLKIIWSPSPYASAQLFEELKQGKEEPDIQYAASIGGEQDLDVIETKYNSGVFDFVQKLPGITSKNIDTFLRKSVDLTTATSKNEEELKEILGNSSDASALYSILNNEHTPKEETSQKKGPFKGKSWFSKYAKKKSIKK